MAAQLRQNDNERLRTSLSSHSAKALSLSADVASLRASLAAARATLATRDATVSELRGALTRAVAALPLLRDKPQEHDAHLDSLQRAYLTGSSFIDAFIVLGQQRGFAADARRVAGLCRATWDEEQLWRSFQHLPLGKWGRTALMFAAHEGNVPRIRWLHERCGAQLDARGAPAHGDAWAPVSALGFAAAAGRAPAVRALLALGAFPNSGVGEWRPSPLQIALKLRREDAALALIEGGAAVGGAEGCASPTEHASPLQLACRQFPPLFAHRLLERLHFPRPHTPANFHALSTCPLPPIFFIPISKPFPDPHPQTFNPLLILKTILNTILAMLYLSSRIHKLILINHYPPTLLLKIHFAPKVVPTSGWGYPLLATTI
jgi:hypothetical protein